MLDCGTLDDFSPWSISANRIVQNDTSETMVQRHWPTSSLQHALLDAQLLYSVKTNHLDCSGAFWRAAEGRVSAYSTRHSSRRDERLSVSPLLDADNDDALPRLILVLRESAGRLTEALESSTSLAAKYFEIDIEKSITVSWKTRPRQNRCKLDPEDLLATDQDRVAGFMRG